MTQDRVVTIHDVANRAGVAVSSVSRVLSNHPDVSDAMRAKVERAVRELGYQPDPVAQGLRSGTTRAVGLIVRDYSTPFFAEVITGIESVLSIADYTLLVTSSGRDISQEVERIRMLRQRRVDAILLATVSDKSMATRKAIKSFGRPVVLLDREFNRLSTGRVLLDHASGVKAATKDLLSLGHRRIAFITGTQDIRPTRERLRGFMEAFEEAGIDSSSATMIAQVFSASFARSQTIELLSDNRSIRPTALIAGGVQTTSGILEALDELSMLPGRDVSLVVCDDLPWLRVSRPSISVVTRDPFEMGSVSATMVLEMLAGAPAHTVTLPTEYAARDSTQPLFS
ncbi:MAG: LacI family transcriptional regulator [Actinobacteria bacterium]|nr:LacI family transcriptional regulator [Actinomycetota bacterium]